MTVRGENSPACAAGYRTRKLADRDDLTKILASNLECADLYSRRKFRLGMWLNDIFEPVWRYRGYFYRAEILSSAENTALFSSSPVESR